MRPVILLVLVTACSDVELSSSSQELITERNATVTAGLAHSCAIQSDGTIQCWGRNLYGQLGNNTTTDSAAPVTVAGITTAVMVSAGDYHTCAVLASGAARCWGLGSSGQIGNGSTANRLAPASVALAGVTSISAGGSHTCASLETGQVRCWGSNSYGQLGTNSTTSRTTPQPVLRPGKTTTPIALSDVVEVEAGRSSTCARQGTTGAVQCWGRNNYGQLGDGTSTQRTLAGPVAGLANTRDISVGDYHACAVLSNGRVSCWGMNLYGQLGDNTQTGRLTPVQMQRRITPVFTYPIVNVTAVAAGGGHTCVRSAGELWCAGRDDNGELGRDPTGYLELLAVQTAPIVSADELATGQRHTCARRPSGVICFGRDTYGQVGELGRCPATPTATIASVRRVNDGKSIEYRGGLRYTDDHDLDVVIETTPCAQLASIDWKYGTIGPGDPIEPSNAESYEVRSTVDRADGVREIAVRIHWDNGGTGITYPTTYTLASPAGRTASASFMVVEAVSVHDSDGRVSLSQDELANEVLGAIYEKFGDRNYWHRNGVNLYEFDYNALDITATAQGISFAATMKADMLPGENATNGCNPTVHSWGTFQIGFDDSVSPPTLTTHWASGPGGYIEFPIGCNLGGVLPIIAVLVQELSVESKVAAKLEKKIAGLTSYCSGLPVGGCALLQSVSHVEGGVTVALDNLFPSVTFRVPYHTQVHGPSIGDPMRRGIGVPPDAVITVVPGGLARACYSTSGTCTPHDFGAAGLFNWQWQPYDPHNPDPAPHPPMPDPWPDCEGTSCVFPGRIGPWQRQRGLSRAPWDLPAPDWNVGRLIGRVLHEDGTFSPLMSLGDLGCRIDPAGGSRARIVVGRNDVDGGQGPYSGEYGTGDGLITLNFAVNSDGIPACATAPGFSPPIEPPPLDGNAP